MGLKLTGAADRAVCPPIVARANMPILRTAITCVDVSTTNLTDHSLFRNTD